MGTDILPQSKVMISTKSHFEMDFKWIYFFSYSNYKDLNFGWDFVSASYLFPVNSMVLFSTLSASSCKYKA